MKKKTLDKKLCINVCPYYKPSKDNELACRGFFVVERLMRGGKNITFQKPDTVLTKATEEMLVQNMCTTCPFYKENCDFIQYREKVQPCGGFILLGHLLESGVITIDDIMKNIN